MDDQELIRLALGGKLSAFNTLVLTYQAQAYNLAYRLLGEGDAAADATQDSFLKAYRGLHTYHGGSFRAWLLRIVTNTCYDVLRTRRHYTALSLNGDESEDEESDYVSRLVDPGEGPEAHALRSELAERIQVAMSHLPAEQRAVLVLADVEGYSYQETAEIVGCTIGTVKSRLWRARAHMRDILHVSGDLSSANRPPKGAPAQAPSPSTIY